MEEHASSPAPGLPLEVTPYQIKLSTASFSLILRDRVLQEACVLAFPEPICPIVPSSYKIGQMVPAHPTPNLRESPLNGVEVGKGKSERSCQLLPRA